MSCNSTELQRELSVRLQLASTPLHQHIAPILHPVLLSVPTRPGWQSILLEKGITDLQHLCGAMCQGTTHSRMADIDWKLAVAQQLIHLSEMFTQQGLVWYDFKPSNLIIFPTEEIATEDSAGGESEGMQISPVDSSAASGVRKTPEFSAAASDYRRCTATHKWLRHCQWDLQDFVLKATDLSSVHPVGAVLSMSDISCTARFAHPTVARFLQSIEDTATLVADAAHMQWSVALSVLQLLQPEFKSFYAQKGIMHSADVHAFLAQEDGVVRGSIRAYMENEVVPVIEKLTDERVHKCQGTVVAWLDEAFSMG
jgi:hypothetical protein